MNVKYPTVEVQLTGMDGNAFAIIGAIYKALHRSGVPIKEIKAVTDDMMSGDYDHLLRVAMETVKVL